ncbi:amino acid adenylation domain-containing protein [Streptomyces sp. HPF1205]|uniref:amino acid adenylation domain-containing protein n=1 Tax=Streptomyces sp. HPF1205 TaxID=2873262 RepID=UPI0021F0EF25|nr:amino acid adenylation domain-containing protein [Streptomyces sp. HPF1205]
MGTATERTRAGDGTGTRCPDALTQDMLSPIQRAYLVGEQDGMELRGPARYYLPCDLDPARVAGIGARLRRLVRANPVLRTAAGADLSLSTRPADDAGDARDGAVEVLRVGEGEFDAANDAVRRRLTDDGFAFGGPAPLEVVVVTAGGRARLHLVYALWLMDAPSLDRFLAALATDHWDGGVPPGAAPAGRDRSERDLRYWRERAADLPGAAELPLRPGWRHAGPAVGHRVVTLAAAEARAMTGTARRHGLTPAMAFLAVYGTVLGRYGGEGPHTLTVLYSRRPAAPAYDALGNHGGTMPLAVPGTAGRSFAALARDVQSRYLGQAMHPSLSGAQITRLAEPGGDLRRLAHPFAFTALTADGAAETARGLVRRWDEVRLRVPQVLIDHQVVLESDGRVRLGFDWRADAFDAGFCEDFVERCAAFARRLATQEAAWTREPGRWAGSGTPGAGQGEHRGAAPDAGPVRDADTVTDGVPAPEAGGAPGAAPNAVTAADAVRALGEGVDGDAGPAPSQGPAAGADSGAGAGAGTDSGTGTGTDSGAGAGTGAPPSEDGDTHADPAAGTAHGEVPAAGAGPAAGTGTASGAGRSGVRPVGDGDTLHGRVLRTAAGAPGAPAVHDAHGTLSYGALVARARAVARTLERAGARPGDGVAVHLPRGRGQVVAVLGALLAGCQYVPLDVRLPEGRLDAIARRGAVRFALTGSDAADGWTRRGVHALAVAQEPEDPPQEPGDPPQGTEAASATGCPTAYTIFTSGSTGEPKGVVISHTAVLTTVDAVNRMLGLGAADRVLSVSSIGFDLSVWDIFGPLTRGGSVVMLSEETARDPGAWVRLVRAHGVTVWNSAPPLASLLAEEGASVPSVRAFLLSGDWIALSLPGALRRLAPHAQVVSLGGATEASIWSIAHRVGEADTRGRSIPYGRALHGQRILVLDAEGLECPDWQIGEIHIGGAGVATGYAGDPARTAAAFPDTPAFGRLYRTGDRGRRLPGGVVEFLGRTDTQVKLNGHRVELAEIEQVLARCPGVRGAAVCVRGEGARRKPVAFITLLPDAAAGWRADAEAALRHALPAYMVPDALVEVAAVPLTGSGKVDRRKLAALPLPGVPAPAAGPGRAGPEGAAPGAAAGPFARAVAACWHEVLGEPPGAAGFFDAGGGSYDAIRLLSLLRSRHGYQVAFGEFVADPTAAALAARCRESAGGAAESAERSAIWTHRPRVPAAPRLRLVLFPPVGGGTGCYGPLLERLGADVETHLVGFDAPVGDAAGGLAELAALCTARLPREVLSGRVPLVFCGWSFGGALAFEAARGRGAAVDRVVCVDSPVSAAARAGEPSLDAFARDVRLTTGAVVDAGTVAADPALSGRFAVYRQNLALLRAWSPEPSAVPVVELRAADGPAEPDPGAWRALAPAGRTVTLAGGHFQVFAPGNSTLVAAAIEEVRGSRVERRTGER